MFTTVAYAQAAGAASSPLGDAFSFLFPLVMVMGVFWFFIIRPQQKKVREHQETLKQVRRGDTVVFAGMIGKVHRVIDDHEILLELAENIRVKALKSHISDVRIKGEPVKDGTES